MTACAECGVDEERLSVADAVAAIRTFPRRYREALAAVDDAGAQTASRALADRFAAEVQRAATELAAALTGGPGPAPGGDALATIQSAADAIAELAAGRPTDAWTRTTAVDGAPRSARTIVTHAAHLGAHHLREISRVAGDADAG